VPIEQIARLGGHTGGSAVTETVYRKATAPPSSTMALWRWTNSSRGSVVT